MSEDITALSAAIASAREKASAPETADALIVVGDTSFICRMTAIGGRRWNTLTGNFPPREGNHGDAEAGFDVDALTDHYVKTHSVLVTEDERTIRPEPDEWDQILDVLDAPDLNNLGVTMWVLNVGRNVTRLALAGKAWREQTEKGSEEAE